MSISMNRNMLCLLVLLEVVVHRRSFAFQNVRKHRLTHRHRHRRGASSSYPKPFSCLSVVKEASFGCGCFWEPAESFLAIEGVEETIAGYTGNPTFSGSKPPTYESVCYGQNWVEAVRIKYDDQKVSYQDLLDAMFEIQKPQPGSRQYASIIFPHDDEQSVVANAWMDENKDKQRSDGWRAEWTEMEPLSKFYKAEGYHQQYWQKQRPRFAVIGLLLAISVGFLNSVIPETLQDTVENGANGMVLALGLYITLERFIDSKVVEI